MRRATASAPAKIILLGEHAAVYGQPALATPIDRGIEVTVWLDEAGEGAEPLPRPFGEVLSTLGLGRAWFRSKSSVPVSAGLGTSAAYAAATIRALFSATGRSLSQNELWELTRRVEAHHHGSSSGLDPAAVLAKGPILFEKGEPPAVEPIAVARPARVLIGIVGERGSTRTLVEGLAQRRAADPERHERLFSQIGELAQSGARALRHGDLPGLGALMSENQRLLREAELSSSRLDAWCSEATRGGALGAKLTGAGGGGAAIALVEDAERLGQRLAQLSPVWFTAALGRPA